MKHQSSFFKRNISKKFTLFTLPIAGMMLLSGCASKPEGYAALPPGTDVGAQMDQTENAMVAGREAHLSLLAPKSFERAEKAFKEAKEDRGDNQSDEEVLEDLALTQAYLKAAQKTAQITSPALEIPMRARQSAVDAEAPRVLSKKLKNLDDDFRDLALEIEEDGDLSDARDDGPELAEQYAKLRTESLEKGGRSLEQQNLADENVRLKGELEIQKTQAQQLQATNDAATQQTTKLQAVRDKFARQEAEVLVNRDNEIVIRLKGLKFPSNKADVPAESLPLLTKVEQAIAEFPGSRVVVEGHTDSVGSKELNQELSEKRAQAVSGYLTQSASDVKREIEALGKGPEEPISSNKTAEGRAANRRIDIVVSPTSAATL